MSPFKFQLFFFENSRIAVLFSLLCSSSLETFSGAASVSVRAAGYVSHHGLGSGSQVPPSFVSNLVHYRGERTAHTLWKQGCLCGSILSEHKRGRRGAI